MADDALLFQRRFGTGLDETLPDHSLVQASAFFGRTRIDEGFGIG